MRIQAICLQQGKLAIRTHLQFAINGRIIQKPVSIISQKKHISPLFSKKDEIQVESNYRRICRTNTLSKVFERFFLIQIMEYFNSLLNFYQFGFQKPKTCN